MLNWPISDVCNWNRMVLDWTHL